MWRVLYQSSCRKAGPQMMQVGYYSRKRGKGHYGEYMQPGHGRDPSPMTGVEEAEMLEDWYTQRDKKHLWDLAREEERARKTLKYKIIEKKYFRPPQELNLLTWDAKEQIRYLNREYPDEWTIEKLSESFPISKEGVVRILRSSFVPRTMEEVIRHDSRVQKHWLALKAGNKTKIAGPIVSRYEKLLQDGKTSTLNNAAGIKALPLPKWEDLLKESTLPSMEPGPYGSIVKDYCDKKKALALQGQEPPESKETKLLKHKEENIKLLAQMTKSMKVDDSSIELSVVNSTNVSPGVMKQKSRSVISRYKYKDSNLQAEIDEDDDVVKALQSETLFDSIDQMPVHVQIPKERHETSPGISLRKGRKRLDSAHKDIADISSNVKPPLSVDMESLQMAGTGKIDDLQNDGIDDKGDDTQNDESGDNEYHTTDHVYRRENDIHKRVKVDRSFTHGQNTSYLYDHDKGYQYPYGRFDTDTEKIDIPVPEKGRGQSVLVRKGNSYYDENGEFLYRVP